MRDEVEQLNSEIKSLEADVRYTEPTYTAVKWCTYTILSAKELSNFVAAGAAMVEWIRH